MRLQIVLPLEVPIRRHKEILKQDVPGRAFAVRELKCCSQRDQHRGRRGWVDDSARLIIEYRVVLVFA